MSARPSVRPSTKCFFDFNEIWHVSRGWWAMHDGMQYDLIQGQGREPFKVGNPSIFKSYLLCHLQWELATDHWILNLDTTSKFNWVGFSIFVLVCVTWLWTWQKRQLRRVDRQSHTGKFVFFVVCTKISWKTFEPDLVGNFPEFESVFLVPWNGWTVGKTQRWSFWTNRWRKWRETWVKERPCGQASINGARTEGL